MIHDDLFNEIERIQKSTLQLCQPIIPMGLHSRSIEKGRHGEMEARLFLEKDRRKVGRTSRVAPPVVIREESSHRSPGHLTGYRLPKEKRSEIEKNGRDERKARSGRTESELPISCARLGIRLRHSERKTRGVEEGGDLTMHSHVWDYFLSPAIILLYAREFR